MFSRQHYLALAEVAKSQLERYEEERDYMVVFDVMEALCVMFEADNPHFDREKFTKACGLTG